MPALDELHSEAMAVWKLTGGRPESKPRIALKCPGCKRMSMRLTATFKPAVEEWSCRTPDCGFYCEVDRS